MPQSSEDIRLHNARIVRMAPGISKAAAWFDTLSDMLTVAIADSRTRGATLGQLEPFVVTQARFLELRNEITGVAPAPGVSANPSPAPPFVQAGDPLIPPGDGAAVHAPATPNRPPPPDLAHRL